MLLNMKIVLLILMTSVVLDAGKSYPGFTVFDNGKGEYLRVVGPTLGLMSIAVTKPPYYVNSRIIYNLEFIPSETINALFQKGQLFLEGFPIWSQDGTDNLCDHPAERKYCPWRVGVKHSLKGSIPIKSLSPLTGFYKANVEWFAVTSKNRRVRIAGLEFAAELRYQ